MIIFKAIRFKNLLSTGNNYTEIELDSNQNTLIVGENGAGKSTVLDALTFALFGKPYRNINKPQLVNSINGKQCMVELGFEIGKDSYMIRRGIKPNVFEIYCNDELVNQDSTVKDYQDMLERMILKMNYKSFTQIVILGSSSFTPFMQLPAADRRAVIEDLLDIQIFSQMNILVKERLSNSKTEINELKIRLDSAKEKIEMHKRHVEEMKRNTTAIITGKRDDLQSNRQLVVEYQIELENISKQVDELQAQITDESSLKEKFMKLVSFEAKIEQNRNKVIREIEFFSENAHCPTCKQDIHEDFKENRVHDCKNSIKEFETGLKELDEKRIVVEERLKAISDVANTISDLNRNSASVLAKLDSARKYVQTLETEIETLEKTKKDNVGYAEESQQLYDEYNNLIERKKVIYDDQMYYKVASQLLKDSGIKTKIIKQYLPIINRMVNKYLAAMDFFANFNINEEFKETIKSRHRDDFSYENFSEGEKQKIDLALLLTWRAVARLKNSVNTNLLMLDETFDSSLDGKGTEALLHILRTLPDHTNIFVISHKDQLHDKFNHSIRFEKKQNFSRIV